MFKQLKLYYVIIGLPFAALLIGSAIFSSAIALTITRNPHPQINYAIFVIILFGGFFILLNTRRLVREARVMVEFSQAIKRKVDAVTLQEMTGRYTVDIASLLQMVAASAGRSISHQEQAAIEHELNNARNRLGRRNALPQYLSGLLVGMGLLGTFIGLLATLTDISALINSFGDLDVKSVDPILVFRTMIERMKAPMQSMGIAFSASMFGLLGSIILGLMMVGVRRLQGDVFTLLSSEVARHIEIALAKEVPVAAAGGGAAGYGGDDYKVLVRIEERLAETSRQQQRMISAQLEEVQKQRDEMLRLLTEQAEANNGLRSELQLLGRHLGDIAVSQEKRHGEVSGQMSELTVHLAGDARETHALLTMQIEEQKRMREALDVNKLEERLAEMARVQQRALAAEIEDFQRQRGDMLRTMAGQTEASNNFRSDLQQLGRQFGFLAETLAKNNEQVRAQISELIVHMAADAKESQRLLALQVNEQIRLRDSLDLRVKSSHPSA